MKLLFVLKDEFSLYEVVNEVLNFRLKDIQSPSSISKKNTIFVVKTRSALYFSGFSHPSHTLDVELCFPWAKGDK